MNFHILGPLSVSDPERANCAPRAPKQRQLLALFLAHANLVVTVDRCIDELWVDRPPASAQSTLHTYVMQIRKLLCTSGLAETPDGRSRLVTTERGYIFQTSAGELDLVSMRAAAERASLAEERHDLHTAAKEAATALAYWHGESLADVKCGPELRVFLSGVEEEQTALSELYFDASIAIGDSRKILSALRLATHRHPLNETFHIQLMTALRDQGRPVQALEAYSSLRRLLNTELGLDPTIKAQRLQRDILASTQTHMEHITRPSAATRPVRSA
ncbi:AfsR/SARP family transcriptional regulator [Rhodococcoides kyotonense]|uniref:DNA-binding transcriptional activator of the SARP family n=1 Tax=Rhodococcoides kyotonense TaxID=398843 RepID=A0A239MBF2_9NOCA|nr:AfsR/SARP family transcriptional regulator [Rhodococcus kyotonensis]SNT39820.1 DNA-binding transcriptional activator of the SARP family [Rhodococcus kyotonensis]